jgi:hypothetical protein
MNLNVTTPMLDRITSICHAPSSGKERVKAELVRGGVYSLDFTVEWLLDLANSTKNVDPCVRTPGVRLAAAEALAEIGPLVIEGAARGDVILRHWEPRVRKYVSDKSKLPQLRMA